MFSKSKINEPGQKQAEPDTAKPAASSAPASPAPTEYKSAPPKAKPPASVLSSDLHVTGNMKTTGDINVEGTVEGDIRAHLLTIGETATIKGEVIADDVVVNGRIVGRVRGLKVRLTSTARVEGDIIHKTIAIESGAHFEGSVQRQDDPLSPGAKSAPAAKANPAS
ncbi:bactofilin family protein [Roseobacter sinensis]|uniref:Polymer-forming cytoskeletal protein n=1 Tax=Roseobacter sinensis TaxID=2931391 RepID=A0ABT3BC02_9RHOB|nr:polymer-forming cytoskeletal protein [Roseobacter sp. WL0113]MCV3271117.1 polymer-forming cytoskeletal protein [Roseobacter sp. WL0113]